MLTPVTVSNWGRLPDSVQPASRPAPKAPFAPPPEITSVLSIGAVSSGASTASGNRALRAGASFFKSCSMFAGASSPHQRSVIEAEGSTCSYSARLSGRWSTGRAQPAMTLAAMSSAANAFTIGGTVGITLRRFPFATGWTGAPPTASPNCIGAGSSGPHLLLSRDCILFRIKQRVMASADLRTQYLVSGGVPGPTATGAIGNHEQPLISESDDVHLDRSRRVKLPELDAGDLRRQVRW